MSKTSNWTRIIRADAPRFGIDPRAALSVAKSEGLSGNVGDHGTSFGPFQLHEGGALPRGQGQGWAESRAGIDYALQQMSAKARGLTGRAAINAIVRGFERPADPSGEVARSLGYYAGLNHMPGVSGAQGLGPITSGPSGGLQPNADMGKQLAMLYLQRARDTQQNGPGSSSILDFATQRQQLQAAAQTYGPGANANANLSDGQAAQGMAGTIKAMREGKVSFIAGSADIQHEKPDFMRKLGAAAAAVGGTKIRVISGYRSPSYNAQVGGAKDSNHTYGRAMDGEVFIPKKGWVPLGTALAPVAQQYGLRSGATFTYHGRPDYPHVDDAYNQRPH